MARGLSTEQVLNMPYHEFMSSLCALPSRTPLMEIVSLRKTKITKDMSSDQKQTILDSYVKYDDYGNELDYRDYVQGSLASLFFKSSK